jgi:hypothetical protein
MANKTVPTSLTRKLENPLIGVNEFISKYHTERHLQRKGFLPV